MTGSGERSRVGRIEGVPLDVAGITAILTAHTEGAAPYNCLRELSDSELVTLHHCASNQQDALFDGLRTLADLISGYDPEFAPFDQNSVGMLIRTLTRGLEDMHGLDFSAMDELARRGLTSSGLRLSEGRVAP